ncbi:MAG: hypothetical protein N3B18_12540 [Desulfobacterota bacterium]|nr:hypothetical protein [Thermodesulfobacteriota bacterium]
MGQTYVRASFGTGRHRIAAAALCIGDDISVGIWGGSRPHIGSVAIAVPRQSLSGSGQLRATSSVFNFTGHKDETVAREIAESIAMRLNRNVVATAGIHVDRMTHRDLLQVFDNVAKLKERLIAHLERRLR